MTHMLTDAQRSAIHNLALGVRAILTREARELLEGVYGLHADGRLETADSLPQVKEDPEAAETYRRLKGFLADEVKAGLPRAEAVDKLVKETAFTHLNRLAAFKMLEARKLMRGALDRGADSNGFKFYLADPAHAQDYARYQQGDVDTAYRRFLLWQAGQIAAEVRVLFDLDALPSRLFPRPRALARLLELLNQPELAEVWLADETIGWVYQYFNEPELQAVRTSAAKFEARDIPAATQLFTPHWIVRFLVQNTLGRLWVELHPDTRLLGTELLDYLTPLDIERKTSNVKRETPLRLVKDLTLLDPACGAMHFGLAAFDLFAAMYQEELERAGEEGWPAAPSLATADEIPAAILANNIYGIDIDLRAVQLAALALYLKARTWRGAQSGLPARSAFHVSRINLACADVLPLNGARLGAFLHDMRFERPVYERLIRKLWERLKDANQLGSLLRLEQDLNALIDEERARVARTPLFAGLPGEFEREAAEAGYWGILSAQVIQALDEFARQQAAQGVDQAFFTGEAVKGLRLAELMLRDYDVVVTNPPYLSRRKMNNQLAALLDKAFPEGKNDFYAAFIQRCLELAEEHGRVGMLTMHSFMFISSYQPLRAAIRRQASIEALLHLGPALFEVGNPGTLQTAAFVLHKDPDVASREDSMGTHFRLVHAPSGEAKRQAFEQALEDGCNTYCVAQGLFDAIPDSPWVYWVSDSIRGLFAALPSLEDVARPTVGLQTGENNRFLRYWWEVSRSGIAFGCPDRKSAQATNSRWFPYMKGGGYCKWYGNQSYVVNWQNDGQEIQNFYSDGRLVSRPQNIEYYFREGITYSYLTLGKFCVRYMPIGFVFDVAGSSIFSPNITETLKLMGILNSEWTRYVLRLINPTVNFQVGDLARVPINIKSSLILENMVISAIHQQILTGLQDETTFDFIAPLPWDAGLEDTAAAGARLAQLEAHIDDEVYRLYGIGDEDRTAIETELQGGAIAEQDDGDDAGAADEEDVETPLAASITPRELAVRWISYAVGVVLGCFQPGLPPVTAENGGDKRGGLGSAVYRRAGLAVGSLPAPDEAEFDELVGPAERFACVDAEGGRHVFPAEVEVALRALAVPDGVAVLDEGHPRDLPALVERALTLMWGEQAAQAIIAAAVGGDPSASPQASLRDFLSREFFTAWHFRWYRKRPVYWPLQSAKRGYGFVLFHERITKDTLYLLQRDYLDHKVNGLKLHMRDLGERVESTSGSARKQASRQLDQAALLLAEVALFAHAMETAVRSGYEPQPNWIDDGVILRLAPLWELVPIWKSEPKKYWERLEKGDFDWSHIAMHYWPERLSIHPKEALMLKQVKFTNFKSFAFERPIEIPRFLILVGNNGAGKTNFCDALEFARDILEDGLRNALLRERRGGFENIVRGRDPAYEITCQFSLVGEADWNLEYSFSIGVRGFRQEPIIFSEKLVRKFDKRPGKLMTYLERDTEGSKARNESDAKQKLEDWKVDPNYLQVARLTDADRFPMLRRVRDILRSVLVLRPDPGVLRERDVVGGEARLGGKGEGLIAILDAIDPSRLDQLAQSLSRGDDFIQSIRLIPAGQGQKEIGILERDQERPYGPQQISDGTLRLLATLTAIIGLAPSISTLVIEEPENGIHFSRLRYLVELCRQRVEDDPQAQIILTTHSIPLLHSVQREEVMAIVREKDGTSQILPPPAPDKWERFQEDAGYTIGDLYTTGLWPECPPRRYNP